MGKGSGEACMIDNKDVSYSDKVIYKNSIFSLLYKGIAMLLSLLSVPLMLHCLGTEKYGVWVSLLSVVSWIYYFDLGVGNGLRNKLAESIALHDIESSKKYLSVSYLLVSGISFLIFIAILVIFSIIDVSSLLHYSLLDENLDLILIIAFFFACVNFVASLVNNIFYAVQRASLVNFFGVVGQVLFILGLIVYIQTGKSFLVMLVIVEGVAQLLKNVVATGYIFRTYSQLKFSINKIDFSYAHGIVGFGLRVFLIQITALILNSTDNIIILRYFGADAVTPYSLCYKYFNTINAFFVVMLTPLLSAYTFAYARHDVEWIKKTLYKGFLLFIAFVAIILIAGFVFEPVTILWLQKKLYFQPGLIFLTGLYFVLLMFTHNFSTLLNGISKVSGYTISTILMAVINVPISVFIAVYMGMGINGVIMGSIISMIIGVVVSPIIAIKELKKLGG